MYKVELYARVRRAPSREDSDTGKMSTPCLPGIDDSSAPTSTTSRTCSMRSSTSCSLSQGVLCWLPDLDRWASVVHRFLKPDGVFYILDGHPFMGVFDQSDSGEMKPMCRYFHHEEQFYEGNEPSYAGSQLVESPVYEWKHSLGEIVTALIAAGLRIEFLNEFPVSWLPRLPRHGAGRRRVVAVPEAQRLDSSDVLDQGDQVYSGWMNRVECLGEGVVTVWSCA